MHPRTWANACRYTPFRAANSALDLNFLILVPRNMRARERIPLIEQHPGTETAPIYPDTPRMIKMGVPRHASNNMTSEELSVIYFGRFVDAIAAGDDHSGRRAGKGWLGVERTGGE